MLLEIKNLKINFTHDGGKKTAVRGIDFAVNKNEIVGLVGESGSGKTVTALSVMRLLPGRDCASRGEILFEGTDLAKVSEKEILRVRGAEIAMIFQEPFTSLNPVLTVGEQVDEAILTHKKISKKEAKKETLTLLEKVRLKDPGRVYDSYPHLLSGGQRQRAMIAMAISMKPKLLIADEPTTALDVTIQAEILELILELKREIGMSVLFISHDFGVINKVVDRFLIMKEGILVAKESDYAKRLLEASKLTTVGAGATMRKIHIEAPVPTRASAITLKNLTKTFVVEKGVFKREGASVKAVRNVSLEIKEGKTLGVVGESGSGKTTLGKLLMGLLKADSGTAELATPAQIVFQDPYSSLDPRMRMQDIVLEGPVIRGMKKSEREGILRDVLFKVHLNYKDRLKYPHQFSGGERQRIAIARALAVKPRILILDEPVSSLDVIIQREILKLLKDLQKELSLTYIFISHDLRVVEYMADEVAVMQEGEIVECAPCSRIYASPRHPYTKRLLASAL